MARGLRFFIWTCAVVGGVSIAAWQLLGGDTISGPKASFLTMTQALSTATDLAQKCWSEQSLAVPRCSAARAALPKSSSTNLHYFTAEYGALVGVDYENRVVVILTPKVEEGRLVWHCAGSPREVLAKACVALE